MSNSDSDLCMNEQLRSYISGAHLALARNAREVTLHGEIHATSDKELIYREESRMDASRSANATNIVWVFLILEAVLTIMAGRAVWEKAGARAPFFTTWTLNDSHANKELYDH